MRIRLGKFGLDHDRDYGAYGLTGWSFIWGRSYRVQLEKYFLVGLIKFIRTFF